MVIAEEPWFVKVVDWGALVAPTVKVPKLSRLLEALTSVPTPLRLTICGPVESLSLMVRAPVRDPLAVGVKVSVIMQSGTV
jgi:hypothetical protein